MRFVWAGIWHAAEELAFRHSTV